VSEVNFLENDDEFEDFFVDDFSFVSPTMDLGDSTLEILERLGVLSRTSETNLNSPSNPGGPK
jgi:hypothetical protein